MSSKKELTTDSQIKGLPAQPEKVTYYAVSGAPNLYLQHALSGVKQFVYQCRYDGKALRLKMGVYPALDLAHARILAHKAKAASKEGQHPDEVLSAINDRIPKARVTTLAPTLQTVIDEYIAGATIGRKESAGTREDNRRRLYKHIVPQFGQYPITQTDAQFFINALEAVGRYSPPLLEKLIGNLKSVYDFAQIKHAAHIPTNPLTWQGALKARLSPYLLAHEEQNFHAVPVAEMPAFYAALRAQAEGNRIAKGVAPLALMFLILTGARTEELIGRRRKDSSNADTIATKPLTWQEIDLEGAVWRIAPDRTKNGRGFDVPLSAEAVRVLRETRKRTKAKSPLAQVFPSHMAEASTLPSNSFMRAVIGRIGLVYPQTITKRYQESTTRDALPTVHGMRSTLADFLAEIGAAPNVISATLNHVNKNGGEIVTDTELGKYQRSPLYEQRAEYMETYAEYLLTGQKPLTHAELLKQMRLQAKHNAPRHLHAVSE